MRTFLAILVLSSGLLLGFDYVLKPWLVPSRPNLAAVSVPEPIQPVRGERVESASSPVVSSVPVVAAPPSSPLATLAPLQSTPIEPARSPATAAVPQIADTSPVVVPAAVAAGGSSRSTGSTPASAPPITTPVAAVEMVDPVAQAEAEARPRASYRRPAKTQQSAADPARRKVQELFTNPLGRF